MMLSNGGRDAILEENCGYDEEPTQEEVEEYARLINVDPQTEHDLMYIAQNGIRASLPENWKPILQNNGKLYYFNFLTKENSWEHPCDHLYRKMAEKERLRAGRDQTGENMNGQSHEHINGHKNSFPPTIKSECYDRIDSSNSNFNDSSFLTLHDLKNDSDCTQSGSNEKTSSQITQLFTTPMSSPIPSKDKNDISVGEDPTENAETPNGIKKNNGNTTENKNLVDSRESNTNNSKESVEMSALGNEDAILVGSDSFDGVFLNNKSLRNVGNNLAYVNNHSERIADGMANTHFCPKMNSFAYNKIPLSVMKSYDKAERSLEAKWQKYQKFGSAGLGNSARLTKKSSFTQTTNEESRILYQKIKNHKNRLRTIQDDIEKHLSRR